MRVNTDSFNAIWIKSWDVLGFGVLVIEHNDGRNWKVVGTLQPADQDGMIAKANWYINNMKPTTTGASK
jgi:hypothetical protein